MFEVVLGFTGIVGFLLRWVTPLGIAPCIALVGLSLFEEAARLSSGNWGAAFMSIILMTIFSQYFQNVALPVPAWNRGKGFHIRPFAIFKLFPILLAILISWGACFLMTETEYLAPGDAARTDIRASIIDKSPWIRVPYPGQFGMPRVSISVVLGMLSAILSSVVESVGDYYACARLSQVPTPPTHAINRGIWMEGIGCIAAGLWGGGCGLTSYSTNISIIAVTKDQSAPPPQLQQPAGLPRAQEPDNALLRADNTTTAAFSLVPPTCDPLATSSDATLPSGPPPSTETQALCKNEVRACVSHQSGLDSRIAESDVLLTKGGGTFVYQKLRVRSTAIRSAL
ncbi:solute carrier family 23 member 2-like [Ixodes scapularis]